MSISNADAILELAAATALPDENTPQDNSKAGKTSKPSKEPLSSLRGLSALDNLDTATQSQRKSRSKRSSQFTIFCDETASGESSGTAPQPGGPSLKRAKTVARLPLSERSISSTNNTTAPSPRSPDTPFVFSFADPLWEDTENYEPLREEPSMSPMEMPSGTTPYPMAPSVGPPPPPRHSSRARRVRKVRSPRFPRSMEVYTLLGLRDWKVGKEEIRAAYRQTALEQHPDRTPTEGRNEATLRMQHLNAAKDLLLNEWARFQYHIDGKVPWDNAV